MRVALGWLTALALAACSGLTPPPPEDDASRGALIAEVQGASAGDVIDLHDTVRAAWDRVAIFGPYAYNRMTRDTLGFEVNIEAMSPWTNTEGGAVLVFAEGDDLVGWFGVSSDDVALFCLYGVHPLAEARFTLTIDQDDFRELASLTRPSCPRVLKATPTPGP